MQYAVLEIAFALSVTLSLSHTHTQLGSLGIKSEGDLKYLDPDGLKGLSLSQVSKAKIRELVATASLTLQPADEHTHSDIIPWLKTLGLTEGEIKAIMMQFMKPEYGITNRSILFSLDDEDIDEVLVSLSCVFNVLQLVAVCRSCFAVCCRIT